MVQDTPYPPVLEEYLDYVNDMDFDTEPDYAAVREMFEKCVTGMGKSLTGKLVWNKPKPRGRKAKKSVVEMEDENSKPSIDEVDDDSNTGENVRRSKRVAEANKEEEDKDEDTETSNTNWNWERVLSKNPERIMRKKKPLEMSEKEADFERRQKQSLENPTPEMSRLLAQIQELDRVREEMKDQDQLQEFNKQRAAWLKDRYAKFLEFYEIFFPLLYYFCRFTALEEAEPEYHTPAMQEISDRLSGVTRIEEKFEFKPVVKEVSDKLRDILMF